MSHSTREKELRLTEVSSGNPGVNRISGLFREFKPNRLSGLVLNDSCPGDGVPAVGDIADPQVDEIASTEFAVDREIEQGEIPDLLFELKPDSDGPDLLELERGFGTSELPFVPGNGGRPN